MKKRPYSLHEGFDSSQKCKTVKMCFDGGPEHCALLFFKRRSKNDVRDKGLCHTFIPWLRKVPMPWSWLQDYEKYWDVIVIAPKIMIVKSRYWYWIPWSWFSAKITVSVPKLSWLGLILRSILAIKIFVWSKKRILKIDVLITT